MKQYITTFQYIKDGIFLYSLSFSVINNDLLLSSIYMYIIYITYTPYIIQ